MEWCERERHRHIFCMETCTPAYASEFLQRKKKRRTCLVILPIVLKLDSAKRTLHTRALTILRKRGKKPAFFFFNMGHPAAHRDKTTEKKRLKKKKRKRETKRSGENTAVVLEVTAMERPAFLFFNHDDGVCLLTSGGPARLWHGLQYPPTACGTPLRTPCRRLTSSQ